MKKDRLFKIAAGTVRRLLTTPEAMPSWIELDDVIQELALRLLEAQHKGVFTTVGEAHTVAQYKLYEMYRSWIRDKKLKRKAAAWLNEEYVESLEAASEFMAIGDEAGLTRIIVQASPRLIARITNIFRSELQELKRSGYKPLTEREVKLGFMLLTDSVPTPLFLARLVKALMMFGATYDMAIKVIGLGLASIRADKRLTEQEQQVLYDYQRRAGKGVTYERTSSKDIILKRGRFCLWIGVA